MWYQHFLCGWYSGGNLYTQHRISSTTPPLALTRGYGYSGWGAISGGFDQLYFANVIKSADWFAAEYNNDHAPATFAAVSGIGACVGTCGAGGGAATVI